MFLQDEISTSLESFVDRKYCVHGYGFKFGKKILERVVGVGGQGLSCACRCERSFVAGCRVGWLISHFHDYIGEMENIYIRARRAEGV